MQVIDNEFKVSCAVQSCVHGYQATQYSAEKHSSHRNSAAVNLKRLQLARASMNSCYLCHIPIFIDPGDFFYSSQVNNFAVPMPTIGAFSYFSVIPKALLNVSCCLNPSFAKSVMLCIEIYLMVHLHWFQL